MTPSMPVVCHEIEIIGDYYPDPQRDLKIRSPRTIWELYKDYIGVLMGLYRGSNLWILPGVWVGIAEANSAIEVWRGTCL